MKRAGSLKLVTAGLFGLLLAALLAARHEAQLEAADARTYPPPGQMVDVGGHRLHLYCTGAGSPAVVVEAGWGDWSRGWSGVQADVAKTSRVCTYDRAGMGHSEAGPLPRTAEQFARELHVLLERAGVEGPYVMAGHSLGGLPVRVFARDYAPEVAGVVLIDSMSPGQATPPIPRAVWFSDQLLTLPARLGLVRAFTGSQSGLTQDDANAYAAHSVSVRALQTTIDDGRRLQESLAQARRAGTLGDVPLIVLSRGLPQDGEQAWQRAQSDLLTLSNQSRQLFAHQSHHNIHFEQPAAAVGAILQMVEHVRALTPATASRSRARADSSRRTSCRSGRSARSSRISTQRVYRSGSWCWRKACGSASRSRSSRLHRTRYVGHNRMHLGHVLTALSLNFLRLAE